MEPARTTSTQGAEPVQEALARENITGRGGRETDCGIIEKRVAELAAAFPGVTCARVAVHPTDLLVFVHLTMPVHAHNAVERALERVLVPEFGLEPRLKAAYYGPSVTPSVLSRISAQIAVEWPNSRFDVIGSALRVITPDAKSHAGPSLNAKPFRALAAAVAPELKVEIVPAALADLLPALPEWLVQPRSFMRGEFIEIHHSSSPDHHDRIKELEGSASRRSPLPIRFVYMPEDVRFKGVPRSERKFRAEQRSMAYPQARARLQKMICELFPGGRARIEPESGALISVLIFSPRSPEELQVGPRFWQEAGQRVETKFRYWRHQRSPEKKVTPAVSRNALAFMAERLPDWLLEPQCFIVEKSIHLRFGNVMDRPTSERLHALASEWVRAAPLPIVLEPKMTSREVYRILVEELRTTGWCFHLNEAAGRLELELNTAGGRNLEDLTRRLRMRTGLEVSVVARDKVGLPPLLSVDSNAQLVPAAAVSVIQAQLPAWIHAARLEPAGGGLLLIKHGCDLNREPELQSLAARLSSAIGAPIEFRQALNETDLRRVVIEEFGNAVLKISCFWRENLVEIESRFAEEKELTRAAEAIESRTGFRAAFSCPDIDREEAGDRRRSLNRCYDRAIIKAELPSWLFVSDVSYEAGRFVVRYHNELTRMGDLAGLKGTLASRLAHPVELVHSFRDIDLYRIAASEIRRPGFSAGFDHRGGRMNIALPAGLPIDRTGVAAAIRARCGFEVMFEDCPPRSDSIESPNLAVERALAELIGTSHFWAHYDHAGKKGRVTLLSPLRRPELEFLKAVYDRCGYRISFEPAARLKKDLQFDLEADLQALRLLSRQIPGYLGRYLIVIDNAWRVTVRHQRAIPWERRRDLLEQLNGCTRFKVSLVFAPHELC